MSLEEMMKKDLADSFSLKEFGVKATHYFGADSTETLNVIFDEATEVVLEKGEYAGIHLYQEAYLTIHKHFYQLHYKNHSHY